ncbi:MAG: ClbS/DfsB family four-helix bundle protein [Anaerolineae bacterium]|nr:ClbS/DfsB family four-helix bundle protein [Anaerolineae bacterium]
MTETTSKDVLLNNLRTAHTRLYTAIDELTENQMTLPGVVGEWSIKDLIAHFTYWEHRAAFLIESAIDGYREEADIWKIGSVDDQNARNFDDNKTRPLTDVLADSHAMLETLLSLIERLPEQHLVDPSRFGWPGDETLGERIAGETFGHIEEHWPDLQSRLTRRTRR